MPLVRPLRIIIPGGTGHLGLLLARHFYEQGHSVSTVTRFPKPRDWEAIHWDAENLGDWAASFEGADAVINLAGCSMHCRYTESNKRAILESRLRTTQLVGEAIGQCTHPPRVWLNASTVDIYPASQLVAVSDSPARESIEPAISEQPFSSTLVKAWEAAVSESFTPGTRKVMLRLASVMSPDSGKSFDTLLWLVRWGIGGDIGSGEQYVAWLHDFDFLRAVEFLIECDDVTGPVNVTAPCPLPNHQFMCNLRRSWCTSYFGLRMPEPLVKTTSVLLRTESERVLKSRRVIPQRLLDSGFSFHFPEWRGACENLVERWRMSKSA